MAPHERDLNRLDIAEWIASNGKDEQELRLWLYGQDYDEEYVNIIVGTLNSY